MKKIGRHATVTAIITGMSNARAEGATVTPVGDTIAASPNTARMLKRLLPTALPTAISVSPRRLAITDVAISGDEVPIATMVRPMISSLSPKALAMTTALSTSQRDPSTRAASPPTTMMTCRRIWRPLSRFSAPNSCSYSCCTAGFSSRRP